MPTLRQLEQALMKADAAGDDAAARQIAAEIKRVRAQQTQAKKPKVSRTKAFGAGLVSGFENVSNTIAGIAGDIVDKFDVTPAQAVSWAAENLSGYSPAEAKRIAKNLSGLPGFGDIVRAGAEKRQERFAPIREQRPNVFAAGQIGGEIAATAPIITAGGGIVARGGGALARGGGQLAARGVTGGRAVQKAGRAVQMGGRAVQTGGVGVRAPTRTAVAGGAPIAATRTGRMGLRVGGGATAGAAAAVLSDQELTDAVLAGSVIPVLGTIGRRGVGFVYDALRGRLGEVRAAEVMRNLISSNPSEIANALRNAPEDARTNTAEFLASQGLLTPELAAATRLATASAEGAPLEQVARARAAGQEEMRAALRGGATGTEAMQNIGAMRQQVGEVTDPMRAEALRRADIGRTQIIPAEREAARLRDASTAEVDRARRFLLASDDEMMRLAQMDDLGDPLDMAAINRQRGIVSGLEQRGAEAAQQSLRLGAASRSAEEVAANLRAQGLQPLDIGTVVGNLRQKAAEAEFVNPPRFRVLTEFANNLERRAASQGGVIDATGLYELRKGMADTVADLLGPMEPGALQRRTAELVGEAKPLIDDAIETAGGSGWRQYLNTFAAGMQNVERQQFARALEKLPEARFERVMAGQDPDFVSKFFGPGRYDINVELFGSQLPVAQQLAGEIRATRAVAATGQEALPPSMRLSHGAGARSRVAEAFQPGMRNIFARMGSRMLGGAPGIYGGGVAADQLAREVSQQISENAMRHLVPGLVSPQSATRLMGVQSSANRMAQIINSLSPGQRAALGQALTQGVPAALEPVPAAPALPVIDVPGADRPFSNFDYDEYGNYIGPR
jgi:hypothetical protein